ncbi:MAG TPA: malto-oligosyltrehalose trehalohydrolase, partial [Terriglobales bacterium]|nr:malto-oligosyltrehalose trehalohydrolase [Terriglobales bacterium]
MPFGAECLPNGSVRFRLWAPKAHNVDLSLSEREAPLPMVQQKDGWFELVTSEAKEGSRYQYQINGGLKVPDPASRFQPSDVHGPSQVIDPTSFQWQDSDWGGRPWEEAVIYELHLGTFSPEGTFAGVEKKLDYLANLGITAIELMPVSDFAGKRNWGYDGVLPFAPDSAYGHPDDLKHLIQSAHAKGMMVFLDVVYNHFGPEGNYLREYSPEFFTSRHHTPWGDGINFDGEKSRTVRDFFIQNALYWLQEYNFDGLRLDAVHAILDDSRPAILQELAEVIRKKFGPEKQVHLILENGDNEAHYLERDQDQNTKWFDAQWNDDIHHALHVLITGETDGYYSDFSKQPLVQLGRCLSEGFAYQSDISEYHGNALRGEPSRHLPPSAFVSFLQNHDQIGNRAFGDRILEAADPQALRAAISILLLSPAPPLLFMGEEFGAKTPFLFFCDFEGDLAKAVTNGRRNEFSRFAKFSSEETRSRIPDPNAEATFLSSKLDWTTINEPLHHNWSEFYRTLLTLRREHIIPHMANKVCAKFVLQGTTGLIVTWDFNNDTTLTLLTNMGTSPIPMPPRPNGDLIFTNDESVTSAWN